MECMVQPLEPVSPRFKAKVASFLTSVFGEWPENVAVVQTEETVSTTMTAEQRQAIIVAHAEMHRKWPAVFHGFNGQGEAVWRPRYGCADNDSE